MAKTQVNFRIDADLLATVKGKAKEEKLESYTQWIIEAIKMRLGELPPSSTSLDDRIGEVIDQRLEKLEGDIQLLDSVKQRIDDLEKLIIGYSCELPDKTTPYKPQEEVIAGIQVAEDLPGETEPSRGIEAERLAPIGIQAKELREILQIPQSTLSDWVKRRERGEGKPSRGSHKEKWDEFMNWEKSDRQWYRK